MLNYFQAGSAQAGGHDNDHDLVGRGILSHEQLKFVQKETGIEGKIPKPILHANQYFHLLKWLSEKGAVSEKEIERAKAIMKEEPFTGI